MTWRKIEQRPQRSGNDRETWDKLRSGPRGWRGGSQCPATTTYGRDYIAECILPEGHSGWHRDEQDSTWTDEFTDY
jgi:hypothetical protein